MKSKSKKARAASIKRRQQQRSNLKKLEASEKEGLFIPKSQQIAREKKKIRDSRKRDIRKGTR
jgi:hypothetical protein